MISGANRTTESSYKAAECIAQHGKLFFDGVFIKEVFLSCADVLFDDLPNKSTIILKIQDMPVSTRTIERRVIEIMYATATKKNAEIHNSKWTSLKMDVTANERDSYWTYPHVDATARGC